MTPDLTAVAAIPLMRRYSPADLGVLSAEESGRFLTGTVADPRRDPDLAWELLYRLEPDLYERLVAAEPLHPGILDWLPPHVPRIIEVGAGTGRLTLDLVGRCDQLTAIEPARPLRERLRSNLPPPLAVQLLSKHRIFLGDELAMPPCQLLLQRHLAARRGTQQT